MYTVNLKKYIQMKFFNHIGIKTIKLIMHLTCLCMEEHIEQCTCNS